MNSVILIGRLTRDPELRNTASNSVATFTLAVDKGLTRDKKQEFESLGKPTADFIRIVVWGRQGEACAKYLAKGRMVAVQGSIQTGSYKTETGETRYTTDVNASKVEFLEWGDKPARSGGSQGGQSTENFDEFEQLEDDNDVPF